MDRGEGDSQRGPLKVPTGLQDGGTALWREVTSKNDLSAAELAILTEACRAKDRCDWLASETPRQIAGLELRIDDISKVHNATADGLKKLIGALRLPDRFGRRPQRRGTPRGTYATYDRKKTS
ncbi:hypothetical protein [Nocardioides sp. Kera G14]|uniref:hypothetical protein n=1 Tax=Nocardioides sp. Kera G14 TaxID=2884264 RepID=UPI001D10C49A|nr:hypothetical protein [Nocardioides sp. Kera G14]UDY22394.1 hypothetical protein LH076_09910 [Nocardioides sp. Kera G14]